MKISKVCFLLYLSMSALFPYSSDADSCKGEIVYPNVFLVLREDVPKTFDWYQIIRSALDPWDRAVGGSPIDRTTRPHVFILDEIDTWTVLFFAFENSRTSSGPGFYDFSDYPDIILGDPNWITHLEKETLKPVSVPVGGVKSLPVLCEDLLPGDSLFFKEKERYGTVAGDDKKIEPDVSKRFSVYPHVFISERNVERRVIDWYQIIRSALRPIEDSVNSSPILHIDHKHICIIDEGEAWAVLFFISENGRMSTGPGFYDLGESPRPVSADSNSIVYIDKETLEIVPTPENGIKSLPLLSTSLLPEDSRFFKQRAVEKEKKTSSEP